MAKPQIYMATTKIGESSSDVAHMHGRKINKYISKVFKDNKITKRRLTSDETVDGVRTLEFYLKEGETKIPCSISFKLVELFD